MVEYVQNSHSISHILTAYKGDIHNFFKEKHPSPNSPYGVDPSVINTFIYSCGKIKLLVTILAGYSVITYILCIGDRHLDNLLVTTDGHFFHTDFDFVGKDPKLFPPPIYLCREVIAALGGEKSTNFILFMNLCVEAYLILRYPFICKNNML